MNDRAAGEIERSVSTEETADTPYPVRNRIIDKRRPQKRKYAERRELHPLGERSQYQGGRDDSEHRLKYHERLMRHRRSVSGIRIEAYAFKTEPRKTSYDTFDIGPKSQAITEQYPLDGYQTCDHKTLHQNRKHVLPAYQPAVEEGQSRRHQ